MLCCIKYISETPKIISRNCVTYFIIIIIIVIIIIIIEIASVKEYVIHLNFKRFFFTYSGQDSYDNDVVLCNLSMGKNDEKNKIINVKC